jgi:hypothetical protein
VSNSGKNNLTLGRGEVKVHRFTIDNPPDAGIGAWTWTLYLYASSDLTTAVLAKTSGFTAVASDTVEMAWTQADTAGLAVGVYAYVLAKDGENLQASFGALTLRPGVPTVVTDSTPIPVTLVEGGTEADLSTSGPGQIHQAALGSALSAVPYAFATTNSGAFDITVSNKHVRTLDGTNGTLSVTGDRVGQAFMLRLIQGGSGGHSVSWASWPGITWLTSDFSAPTIASGAGKVTTLLFQPTAAGSWDGYFLGSSGA